MKKTSLVISIFAVLAILFVSCPADADWYFDIVETSDNVYDVVLFTDEAIVFGGGMGSFNFDNFDDLDWTYAFSYPAPLSELFGSPYEESPGDITNLTGASFSPDPTVVTDTVLATFTFTGTGDANFRWDWDDANVTFEIDSVLYSIVDNPEYFTTSQSSVPVPAAVWLLGSGLVGLAGLRRKFR